MFQFKQIYMEYNSIVILFWKIENVEESKDDTRRKVM